MRIAPYDSVRPSIDRLTVSILVGIQPRHYLALGVGTQAELRGFGSLDSCISEEQAKIKELSFSEAVTFATSQLQNFMTGRGSSLSKRRSDHLLDLIEGSSLVRYGAPTIAPNGGVCQELLMDVTRFSEICDRAKADIISYLVVNEIITQSIVHRNLDRQPSVVTGWAVRLLAGEIRAPSRVPKNLSYVTRDYLIYALVKGLSQRGLSPTRNDASAPESACDAVAIGSRNAKLAGLSSYETVKKIYYSKLSAGA